MRRAYPLGLLTLLLTLCPAAAQSINVDNQRSSPKVLQAFREVVAKPSHSTVRVLCEGKEVALGTIVDANGHILTKASELKDKVTCQLDDGRELPAKVVGVQEPYDLALLKVEAQRLPAITWQPSSTVKVGQWVASVGPGPVPIAVGVVSVATRKFKAGDQPPRNLGANSGYLGVALDEAEGGAKIVQVAPKSPAAEAKLQVNDLVVEAAGKKVLDNESLINIVQSHKPGEEIVLRVRRDEETLELKAVLGRLPFALRAINPQERMGNALSNRRGGFPKILQHDTVLKPSECGGPLVDLEGKAIGINIARAGRTESYAVPAEDVLALLPELKSGRLAPQEPSAEAKAPVPRKLDPNVLLFEEGRLRTQDPLARFRKGCYTRTFTIKLTGGQRVIIDLESNDFDAYLRLEDAEGQKLAEDDDSGGDLSARIVFRVPRDDTYRIVVTSCDPGETGSFELTVRQAGKKRPE